MQPRLLPKMTRLTHHLQNDTQLTRLLPKMTRSWHNISQKWHEDDTPSPKNDTVDTPSPKMTRSWHDFSPKWHAIDTASPKNDTKMTHHLRNDTKMTRLLPKMTRLTRLTRLTHFCCHAICEVLFVLLQIHFSQQIIGNVFLIVYFGGKVEDLARMADDFQFC